MIERNNHHQFLLFFLLQVTSEEREKKLAGLLMHFHSDHLQPKTFAGSETANS